MCSFPFAPIQILTGDIRKPCNTRCGWLLDERRSFQRKPCIERRFESLPGSPEGRNPRRVFAVLFARRKKYQSVLPYREFRGSANLESAHPNNNFPLTKLNPFAASRFLSSPCGGYLPTFCRTQKVGQKSLCPFRGSTPCVHSKNCKGDSHGKKYPRL